MWQWGNIFERSLFSKSGADGRGRGRGSGMPSIVSNAMRVSGNLSIEGELQVEGVIDGDIKCHTVSVGADSAVTGVIECEDARVLGTVTGEIKARSVFVAASARVSSNIAYESVGIESGAYIEGQLKRLDTADTKIAVVGAAKKSGAAVEQKMKDQAEFVRWWAKNVRPAGQRENVSDQRQYSVEKPKT